MSLPLHWQDPCVCSSTSSCPSETHSSGHEHTWSGNYSGRWQDSSPQWLLTAHNDHNAGEWRKKTIMLMNSESYNTGLSKSYATCANCNPTTLQATVTDKNIWPLETLTPFNLLPDRDHILPGGALLRQRCALAKEHYSPHTPLQTKGSS